MLLLVYQHNCMSDVTMMSIQVNMKRILGLTDILYVAQIVM